MATMAPPKDAVGSTTALVATDAIGERNQVVEPPRGRRIEETLDGHMDHDSLARHRRTGPDRAQWTLPPSLPFAQPTFE